MFPIDQDVSGGGAAYREALGQRIATAADRYPTRAAAAEAAGLTAEQLRKWIRGEAKASAEGLRGLAAGAGVDFGWLVTGSSGETGRTLDEATVRQVLTTVLQVMQESDLEAANPSKFADLVISLHHYVRQQAGRADGLADLGNVIRLASRR